MSESLNIEELRPSQINYLIDGFKKWYAKNNSEIDVNYLLSVSRDMFESGDTSIFSLNENNSVVGVFYVVETNENIEICGGMVDSSQSVNNAYFVFDFCLNIARSKEKPIKIRVIKRHYKYEALLRLYLRYGFVICNNDEDSVSLSLELTSS
jgi:hypothetical protein